MPEEIELVNVDPLSGLRYDEDCKAGVMMPFIKGSAPVEVSPCGEVSPEAAAAAARAEAIQEAKPDTEKKNWFQRLFN